MTDISGGARTSRRDLAVYLFMLLLAGVAFAMTLAVPPEVVTTWPCEWDSGERVHVRATPLGNDQLRVRVVGSRSSRILGSDEFFSRVTGRPEITMSKFDSSGRRLVRWFMLPFCTLAVVYFLCDLSLKTRRIRRIRSSLATASQLHHTKGPAR